MKCKGAIKVKSEKEMEDAGYKIDELIIADEFYEFHTAFKKDERILCKKIFMDKCTPRYKKNMLKYSLKICRYIGNGGNDNEPKCPYFIKIYEIFKVSQLCLHVSLSQLVRTDEKPGLCLHGALSKQIALFAHF